MNYLIALGVIVCVWLAIRQLSCWYYKIDERLQEQRETNRLLRKIAGEPDPSDKSDADRTTQADDQLSDEERARAYNKRLYGD